MVTKWMGDCYMPEFACKLYKIPWMRSPVYICMQKDHIRTLKILWSMSELGGTWKKQTNPACTKGVGESSESWSWSKSMLKKKQKNVLFLLEYRATKHPFPTAMSIFSAWDRSIFSMLGQPSLFVAKPASAFFFSLPLGCLSHCCSSDVAAWVCRGGDGRGTRNAYEAHITAVLGSGF